MSDRPAAAVVFDDLITALTEIRDGYVLDEQRWTDPTEIAEAFRYVGQVLSASSELFWEGDPDHPRFASIVSPARKLQGDNPDAIYHFARIRGHRTYRVRGRIREQCYASFTVHGQAADGGMAGPLLGDRNDRDFTIADDGTYEIIFSATPHDGDWVELHPDAHSIVVRTYYELSTSAQNDASIHVDLDIRADDQAPPPPLDDATIATRMAEGVAFLRQATLGQGVPSDEPSPVPFVSNTPNDVATPFSFRDSGLPVPGAADIFYSMGRWDLQDDEALVMTGTLPAGPFANVMLWNVHMQTLDYRNLPTALNKAQIEYEPDGSYRIIISHQDPRLPNWLCTDGHQRGSIFWRFLLPETDPPKPECTVVRLSELG
jgi:hypothetical protein